MVVSMKQFLPKKLRRFLWSGLTLFTIAIPHVVSAQTGEGGSGEGGRSLFSWLDPGYWMSELAQLIFGVVSWVTAKLGQIMNWTIEFFILDMSTYINQIDAIDSLWRILRDLGNIVFIFLILYAAISLILGSDRNVREILPRIIVVALLVNFSLFAAQFIIDTSNLFALQIYENISVSGIDDTSGVNLSNAIMSQTNLTSVMGGEGLEAIQDSMNEDTRVTILYLMSAVVVGVLGFIFAAFAALVTIRFFVLILLMIASPIAFIALALPDVNFGEDWFSWLLGQSFFAPAMMLMLYITLVLGKSMKESSLFSGSGLAEAISQPGGNIDILIFYALMVGMLIASLLVAKQMGAVGADKAVSTGKSIRSWGQAKVSGATAGTAGYLGRTSIGRGGRRLADNQYLKDVESSGGITGYLAQQTRRASEATAQSSFDVRNTDAVDGGGDFNRREGGFDEMVSEQKEFRQQRKESLEELSTEEEERVAKAKSEKQDIDDDISDYEDDISDINSTINERRRIENEIEEAEENNDDGALKRLNNEMNQLVEDSEHFNSKSELKNAEDERDRMEAVKEHLENQQEQLEEIIQIGKIRGEEYAENMMEQQSIMNKAVSKVTGERKDITAKTKGNRAMAREELENIQNRGERDLPDDADRRKTRMSNELRGNTNTGGQDNADIESSNGNRFDNTSLS